MLGKTRPPRLFTIGLGAVLILALWQSLARGQDADNQVLLRAKKAHNDCVYRSVAAQLELLPPGPARLNSDMDMMAESGFAACSTEERAFLMLLSLRFNRPTIEVVLVRNKLDLKRDLQSIRANPALHLNR